MKPTEKVNSGTTMPTRNIQIRHSMIFCYLMPIHPIHEKMFYFVRHGQTHANAEGLMCGGDWDVPLNDIGHKQSLDLSNKIFGTTPPIDEIYTSPMLRAQQTAKNINQKLSLKMTVVEGLREWCVGDWEKQAWKAVPNPFNTTEDPKNGESREIFEERVALTVNQTLLRSSGTALIVSHGAFAHALFTMMGIDILLIDNCELYRVNPFQRRWHLEKVT